MDVVHTYHDRLKILYEFDRFCFSIRVSRKYTKVAMMSFLYCLRREEQNNFSENLPPVRIEPGTSHDPLVCLPS